MKQKKGGKKGECGSGANMQRNVKDRLFRFLFEYDKEALLQLYNALNGTEYRDVTKLQVVTIESAVYVVMKNDLAFVVAGTLNMYEHQSTDCPNLPVRFLIYLAQEYQTVIEQAEKSLYGSGRIKLPTPKCVVFYNGEKEAPEEQILRLSDAFANNGREADVELTVRVLNINYGHNWELMEKCRALKEYAAFVQISREYISIGKNSRETLAAAVDDCIEKGILKAFLKKNRAEVLGMLLEEFDVEKYERTLRSEGMEQGIEQGTEYGIRAALELLLELGCTKEAAKNRILEKFSLSEETAEEKLRLYWKMGENIQSSKNMINEEL